MRPKELIELLTFMVPNDLSVLIAGAPGIGKTQIVEKVVRGLEYDMILSHPVVSDPTDYKGLPFLVDGKAEFLPYGNLRRLMDATKPLVFFIDDFGQAPLSVQAAVMQLLLAREINGQKISDHVKFIACTNRHTDRAGVSGIIEPVKSRFNTIIELTPNLDDWTEWAIEADMPQELISFVKFRPQYLSEFKPTREIINTASPRTIASVGNLLKKGLPEGLYPETIKGAAGEAFGTEFISYRKLFKDLPDPAKVLKDPKGAWVPGEGELDKTFALCGALAHIVTVKTLGNLLIYLERIKEPTFRISTMKDALAKNRKLSDAPEFTGFYEKYHDYIF